MYCDWPLLGRCCFCLPLRKGVITFGYINFLLAACQIGLYSYAIHTNTFIGLLYHGVISFMLPLELCLFLYVVELIFTAALIYGAHKHILVYLKAFYYFSMMTVVTIVLLFVLHVTDERMIRYMGIEIGSFTFFSLCCQIYLVFIVRSLIRKLEISDGNSYENQLQQIVSGEMKVESNGVYNNTTTIPAEL